MNVYPPLKLIILTGLGIRNLTLLINTSDHKTYGPPDGELQLSTAPVGQLRVRIVGPVPQH